MRSSTKNRKKGQHNNVGGQPLAVSHRLASCLFFALFSYHCWWRAAEARPHIGCGARSDQREMEERYLL